MDFASLLGIFLGSFFVVMGMATGGGISRFWNLPSVLVVMGGAMGATMLAFPLKDFLLGMKSVSKIFFYKAEKPETSVSLLSEIAMKAKKGGLLSIEADLKTLNDEFLRNALQMTVDGLQTSYISSYMKKKMTIVEKQYQILSKIFATMGTFAPAFGMVGTLIGLIQMLAELDDPSSIGPNMAIALITTFYGSLLANLIFIPISEKLKSRGEAELLKMTILFEGVLSIKENEHPRLLEEKLKIYT